MGLATVGARGGGPGGTTASADRGGGPRGSGGAATCGGAARGVLSASGRAGASAGPSAGIGGGVTDTGVKDKDLRTGKGGLACASGTRTYRKQINMRFHRGREYVHVRTGDDGARAPPASGICMLAERLAHTPAGVSSTISTPWRPGEEPCGNRHVAMEGIDPSMAFQARGESSMTCVVRTCVELADDGDGERDLGAVNDRVGPNCTGAGRRHWRLTGRVGASGPAAGAPRFRERRATPEYHQECAHIQRTGLRLFQKNIWAPLNKRNSIPWLSASAGTGAIVGGGTCNASSRESAGTSVLVDSNSAAAGARNALPTGAAGEFSSRARRRNRAATVARRHFTAQTRVSTHARKNENNINRVWTTA